MGLANEPSGSSTGAMSARTVERIRSAFWPKKDLGPQQDPETVVEELQEVGIQDAFSSEGLIVDDDDFKLKMDVSLVIMILQNVLLQVSRTFLDGQDIHS